MKIITKLFTFLENYKKNKKIRYFNRAIEEDNPYLLEKVTGFSRQKMMRELILNDYCECQVNNIESFIGIDVLYLCNDIKCDNCPFGTRTKALKFMCK